jgi:hypothetical protein
MEYTLGVSSVYVFLDLEAITLNRPAYAKKNISVEKTFKWAWTPKLIVIITSLVPRLFCN